VSSTALRRAHLRNDDIGLAAGSVRHGYDARAREHHPWLLVHDTERGHRKAVPHGLLLGKWSGAAAFY